MQNRSLDILFSSILILITAGVVILAWLISAMAHSGKGLYLSTRIGKNGVGFTIYKLRTMKETSVQTTSVTTINNPNITKVGRFLRKTKIDELPQLWNILKGDMSFIGPRPDVAGFADKLQGEDRIVLSIKPGITGLASIYFKNEEEILAQQENPEAYNQQLIWPQKIRLNKFYIKKHSCFLDLKILYKTIF
ncbi:lipopolysaccharide/colanic/teichoic acid biosynthesis glycosyltransferase [Mesonia hippocampi]|uniref:Lipopolysaccharide/colanic/teichoic acid biosynthesis glycosyltransferase n=1 Tax=Mesonia hippocampi TaxID=1628250 RepID=A0A840ENM2_9FLAO|nr:sugar transferase [Mesonia hippocampi]MBB4119979.1 lipopolysaccharide/colanic/teichoic acid biosynthesis glycosyltransferase [Mesonia hippocampi]